MKIGPKAFVLQLLIVFFAFSNPSFSQVTVQVKMDTSMLLIGDQTYVTFEASFPDTVLVSLPIFSDTIIDKLEILNISNIDTLRQGNQIQIQQKYLVTSFDSGWYVIPSLDFIIGFSKANVTDTLQSIPVYFGVLPVPLDPANADAITDIKAPIDAPITFKEVLPFMGIGLGALIFLALAYFAYLKWKKKEPIFVKREKPKEPAHLVAFRELDNLKTEKLWQKGLIKEYHSRLTEIIRVYIEDRFGILAMESTTDEIIEGFRLSGDLDRELKDGLLNTLRRADFVKFAKANPLADENDQSMNFAYHFVTKTKPVEVLRDEDENSDKNMENEEMSK